MGTDRRDVCRVLEDVREVGAKGGTGAVVRAVLNSEAVEFSEDKGDHLVHKSFLANFVMI